MSFRSFHFALTCLVVASTITPAVRSAAPNLLNYQGRLTTPGGTPVIDNTYAVTFSIYSVPSGGSALWTETQPVTTLGGIFSTVLGSTIPFGPTIFTDTIRYLGIKVGADQEISPRSRLTSVPYAMTSNNGWADDGSSVHLNTGTDFVGIGTATPTRPLHVSDQSNGLFVSRLETGNTGATVTEISNTSSNSVWESSVAGSAGIPFWGVQPGDMYFFKQGTSFPGAILTSGGNLGLGTGLPRARLEAVSTDTIAGFFGSTNESSTTHVVHSVYTGSTASDAVAVYGKNTSADFYGIGGRFEGGYVGALGISNQGGNKVYTGLRGLSSGDGTGTKYGVYGSATGGDGDKIGARGEASGSTGARYGLYGYAVGSDWQTFGVRAVSEAPSGFGLYASSFGNGSTAVVAEASGTGAIGLFAQGFGTNSIAAGFGGNVDIFGTLSKTAGSFKIDHPLDPENKYLQHSFVESPDMMNIYNGNVITDASGSATITLPNWFEALNKDFRYQLTVIGQFAQAIVSSKIAGNQFSIKTDKPNVEVSWQVTGIRHDPYADAQRIQVEVDKTERERGKYVSPKSYGKGREFGVGYREDLEKVAQGIKPSAIDEKLREIIEK